VKNKTIEPSIPNEILKALEQNGFTLLIKGDAGTGKTTLSLEILKFAKSKIYISSRISPTMIKKQFPWLENEDIIFIDATQTFFQEDSITTQIERAIKFREMPGFLQKLYEIVKNKDSSTIVVIDSWDAIYNSILEESLESKRIETVLTEMVRFLKFNLILITESNQTSLDYISDGVVELKSEIICNRSKRVIKIKKMRGIEITQPEYLFSLHQSRFKHFQRMMEFIPLKKLNNKPPLIKNTKNKLLSYSESLNNFFNYGLKRGTISLLEISEDVGFDYIWVLIPIMINQLQQNHGITLIPDEGLDFKVIYNVLSRYISQDILEKYLTFFDFSPTYTEPNEFIKLIRILDYKKDIEHIYNDIKEDMIKKITERQNLSQDQIYGGTAFFGSNRFENRFGIENIKKYLIVIGEFIKLFKTSRMVYISYFNQKIREIISPMVSTHFKIEKICNVMVIYGERPFANMHVIIINFDKGYPEINLYPIV